MLFLLKMFFLPVYTPEEIEGTWQFIKYSVEHEALKVRLLEPGHLKEDCPITMFFFENERLFSLPADVLWGLFVTHSFLKQRARIYYPHETGTFQK